MRFMVIVKGNKDSEAGVMPPPELFEKMGKYNEELVKAGVMQAGEGLLPSSTGLRMQFQGAERTITEGPFPQPDQLIAGFWLWKTNSRQEAIDWLKRAPFDGGAVIELRQIASLEDFGDAVPEDVKQREHKMRAELEKKTKS